VGPPVFIIGCARSGTSILGEIIAAHPRVEYVWEATAIWEGIAGVAADGSHRLDETAATPSVSKALVEEFAAPAGDKVLVEKSPRNTLRVPFLKAVFPDARIIHIVRDGRDVACSMVPGCAGAEWRHLRPPGWHELMERWHGVERCARAWKEILELALADLEMVPHLQIRYEDLVQGPRATLERVFGHIGLELAPEATAYAARLSETVAGSYHAERQSHWSRPDHDHRIGRFRENMTPEQQRATSDLLAPMLDRLGYCTRSADAGSGEAMSRSGIASVG
jgi:hypothetical protein